VWSESVEKSSDTNPEVSKKDRAEEDPLHELEKDAEKTAHNNGASATKNESRKDCPFISTIKRHLLDFDFEKLCSISLANLNVYACLICGKYYQGRGRNTHAYLHSLETNHHMYINLHNAKVYCLPDNYEVID